ncbi:MAG TPA: hypothetical protein DIT64_15445 [Verrucomicrobiales bacterium]|nr:hypothetical protein [Verrucomicrobiales bacterium]
MKPARHLFILAISSSLAGHLTAAEEKSTLAAERAAIREAASAFCAGLHRERISGLPSEAQLQRLSPLLTPELVSLFQRARVLQQEQMRRHPDEKPYWIEGDLFSSMFEGVTSREIGGVFSAPTVDATVQVRQTHVSQGLPPVSWTDTLVFKRRGQGWLLDDIRMGGDWAFKSGSSLRAILPGGGRDYEDHTTLDERWKVRFTRDGEEVTRVTIQPEDDSSEPFILFGGDGGETCPMPVWVVWGPDGDKLALRLGDSPRFTRTLIFRLVDGAWKPVAMPEFHPREKVTLQGHGFEERDRLVDAEHWQDAGTLVVKYFGSFAKGDEGDGWHQFVSVRIDAQGRAEVVGFLDVPGEE